MFLYMNKSSFIDLASEVGSYLKFCSDFSHVEPYIFILIVVSL